MFNFRYHVVLGLALLSSACQTNILPSTGPSALPSASPMSSSSADPNDSPGSQPTPGAIASANPVATPSATPVAMPSATTSLPAGLAGLRLEADNRFFVAKGQSMRLRVVLLDADNREIPAAVPLIWSSTRPQNFSVDASGLVTAVVEDGFAEIVVQVRDTGFEARLLVSVTSSTGGS